MTGSGDGLNFDFLNEPDPVPAKREPPPAPEIPSPLSLPEGLAFDDGPDESSSSIFDDSSVDQIMSLEQIPEAVPNISDGGTEILSHGRAELTEFNEIFGAPAESVSPSSEEPPVASALSGTQQSTEQESSSSLDDLLGSTTSVEASTPPEDEEFISPSADTAVGFTLSEQPASGSADVPATNSEESGLNLELGEPPALSAGGSEVSGPLDELETPLALGAVAAAAAAMTDPGDTLDDLRTAANAIPSPSSSRGTAAAPANNRLVLISLGGYAIFVTLLCLFLLVMLSKARRAGQLESLPELQPLRRDRIALYPVNLPMPAGHVLKLGEARRFGNLLVEPIKVTRGPATMVHYSGDASRSSYQTSPVLKLWFRFTNESKDQSFAPIDHDLVFLRNDSGKRANNNFLVEQSRKAANGPLVLTFDHTDSNHDFQGQNLGRLLQPGESFEGFYPTSEDEFDQLRGDLIWRVQLRKGLGPSGHGVTTLLEVAFASSEIQSDG